jgi:hypothetical protein
MAKQVAMDILLEILSPAGDREHVDRRHRVDTIPGYVFGDVDGLAHFCLRILTYLIFDLLHELVWTKTTAAVLIEWKCILIGLHSKDRSRSYLLGMLIDPWNKYYSFCAVI